ncbi:MAG: AMP-binding protein [Hyphomicrobiaceae bacterium]|nr:AMP-binding protein [Hyphomicrobiaceae bacterium]
MNQQFLDSLETRPHPAREAAQLSLLPALLRRAISDCPGWAAHLAGVDVDAVDSREALAKIPLLRKSSLKDLQAARPPYGGFATTEPGRIGRVFMSPGPIFEPEGLGHDWWRSARALYAMGVRAEDVVHNTFAYHLTPGGWILDAGARALGCTVIAAGPGNTEQQLEAIERLKPTVYVGVPDYLKILMDKARDLGKDLSSIKKAMVGGGALFPSLRKEYADRGVAVFQCYATADVGLIAYESPAPNGTVEGMVVDEGVVVEIVRPGTGDPVPSGEVGEVVVTAFNRDYPMIRLATGDLSAVLPGHSPCGRTNMRIKGWLGRADQTTKVRGMFVHPEQIAEVARRTQGVGRLRLVVGRSGEQDVMTLKAEASGAPGGLMEQLAEAVQASTKLRATIEIVPPGSLPNDGKVISDERTYG